MVSLLVCLIILTFLFHANSFVWKTYPSNFGMQKQLSLNKYLLRDSNPAVTPTISTAQITLKAKLTSDMKEAMKNKETARLTSIRNIINAIKQKEINDQKPIESDDKIYDIIKKMIKQLNESIKSYTDAGRDDLVSTDQAEHDLLASYLPQLMSKEEILVHIEEVIVSLGGNVTIKEMKKVMAEIKTKLQGKADLALVGELVRTKLSGK